MIRTRWVGTEEELQGFGHTPDDDDETGEGGGAEYAVRRMPSWRYQAVPSM